MHRTACDARRPAPGRAARATSRIATRALALVDVFMVVAIIGVLAAIAAPRYASFVAHQRVEAAARRIAADVASAQRFARISGASVTVQFNSSSSHIKISAMTDLDDPGKPYMIKLNKEPYGVTMDSATFGADADLVFDGYGVPDSSGTVVVSIGDSRKTVTVDAETGRATVSQGITIVIPPQGAQQQPKGSL